MVKFTYHALGHFLRHGWVHEREKVHEEQLQKVRKSRQRNLVALGLEEQENVPKQLQLFLRVFDVLRVDGVEEQDFDENHVFLPLEVLA